MNDATDSQLRRERPDRESRDRVGGLAEPGHDGGKRSLSFFQVVGSTLAAAFGVQSSRNRERDFSHGRVSHFIAAGIIFTVVFVLTVIFVVRMVLSSAAG